jgi:mannose/fructose-specific phosphotransferase system component IIA
MSRSTSSTTPSEEGAPDRRGAGAGVRALVVTHGGLGQALVTTAEAVVGAHGSLSALSNQDLSAAGLQERIRAWLDASPGPALILVDEGGGSCGSAALLASAGRPRTWVLAGANIPMLVAYLSACSQLPAEALVDKVLDRARAAVKLLGIAP